MMEHQPPHPAELLDEEFRFSLAELAHACQIHAESIIRMVEEGILEPEGHTPAEWRFSGYSVRRIQIVVRLQQDLEVNLPGAALAVELLEEVEELRARVRALEGDAKD